METEYKRVYNQLRGDITSGKYAIGSKLPTERELVEKFSVSRITIRKALSLLAEERIVVIRQGSGTWVTSLQSNRFSSADSIMNFHGVPQIEERIFDDTNVPPRTASAYIDLFPVTDTIAHTLDVPSGTNVYRIQRVSVLGDGTPYSFKTNYLRPDLVPNLEAYVEELSTHHNGLYPLLKEHYRIAFHRGSEIVSAVLANFLDAHALNINIGDPLLLLSRFAYTNDGPFEYAETKLIPESYELRINLGEDPSTSDHRLAPEGELLSAMPAESHVNPTEGQE